VNQIAQGGLETLKRDFHYISILEVDAGAKTQTVGSQKMNVHISRAAMGLKLKMMMLQVP
jgi:hypothetical protein